MFQADTALNLLWALLGLSALVYFVYSEAHNARPSTRWSRACRGLALLVVVVALFPCVSASDDSVRFAWFNSKTHPNNNPEKNLATLVRLLEALESVQIPLICTVAVTLCFFAVVALDRRKGQDRMLPKRSGRAPPSSLCLA